MYRLSIPNPQIWNLKYYKTWNFLSANLTPKDVLDLEYSTHKYRISIQRSKTFLFPSILDKGYSTHVLGFALIKKSFFFWIVIICKNWHFINYCSCYSSIYTLQTKSYTGINFCVHFSFWIPFNIPCLL